MLTLDAAAKPPPLIAPALRENRRKWSRIIAEIKAGYLARYGKALSNYKLGQFVELDHSSIEYLEKTEGAQPRHHEGELLLKRHAEFSGTAPLVRSDKPPT